MLSITRCSTVKCLQDKPLSELLRAQTEIQGENIELSTPFVPMVDNHTRMSPLVHRDPRHFDSTVNIRPVPILLGSTRNEGLEMAALLYNKHQGAFSSEKEFKRKILTPVMKSVFGYWKGKQEDLQEAIYRQGLCQVWPRFNYFFSRQYFKEVSNGDVKGVLLALGEMLSDLFVNSCMRQTVIAHREISNSPIFSYIFSHSGAESQTSISRNVGSVMGMLTPSIGSGMGGYGPSPSVGNPVQLPQLPSSGLVWRGDDLLFLWQLNANEDPVMRIDDKLVSQNLTYIWASFAKLGYPQLYRYTESLLQGTGQQPNLR